MSDLERPVPYATITSWLEGATAQHPLLDARVPIGDLGAWDEILVRVERARPLRIAKKREVFQKISSWPACLDLRAELLLASLFAEVGIRYDFARDHPDLIFSGNEWGVEVGARATDGPQALQDCIEDRISHLHRLHILLAFDKRRLRIGAERSQAIANEVERTAQLGGGIIRFDDVGLTATITASSSEDLVVSTTALSSELNDHMAEIEREIDNKIEEKRRQALSMPTILVLDISRMGGSFFRGPETWASLLMRKLTTERKTYAGLGIMISSIDRWLPMQLSVVTDRSAPSAMRMAILKLAERFGLHHFEV
jgi:hypothetical protein